MLKKSGCTYFVRNILKAILFLVLFTPINSHATHISGADMSYRWISGNTFELELTLYRDCSGISAPNTVSINYRSASCGYNLNISLSRVPGTGQEITQNCDSSPTNCTGGNSPGIQKYEYTGNVTLPGQCADWVFGYSICCRNCAITTLSYTPNNCTGVPATYVEATLNNLISVDNSSPVFTNIPVSFFCIGQPFHYNHGAYDPDGDSLVYSFINPRASAATDVVFSPGYTASNPISSSPPISLGQSGDITMNPTAIEVGVMAILVKEYRNGILIGTVVRDMEVWTYPCTNTLPIASGINGTTNFNIVACPGNQLSFNINSSDADAPQSVSMDWNYSIPGATFTTTTAPRPVGTFTWTPSSSDSRSQPYTFTVTVQDNNCPSNGTQTYTYNITVTDLSAIVSTVNSGCASPGSGTAIAIPTGDGPFQYLWSPGNATTSSLNNLSSGNYSVTVTDVNGCTVSASGNVTSPLPVNVSILSTTNVTCNGANNGSISAFTFGGTLPYAYSWSPSGGTGAIASGLSPGTYTATITDAHGCTKNISTTISQPPVLTASATGFALLCYGDANGSASVLPAGGTAPYSYSWSTGATTSSISGRSAGSYSVLITDAYGCSITKSVSVTQPTSLNISLVSTAAFCGVPNGSVTASVNGGTGIYNYNWNPGGATSSTINNLAAGTYTVSVTDNNGCIKTSSIGVSDINGPTVNVQSLSNVKCKGGNDGSASISVSGGQGPFIYQWSPSGGNSTSASGLTAGIYVVNVTDNNNCTASLSFLINEPTSLQVNINSTNPLCNGSTDGSSSTTVSGGAPPYTYTWSPGNVHTPVINNLGAGAYNVTITDANGCTVTSSTSLSQPTSLSGSVTFVTHVSCFAGSDGTAQVSVNGGTMPYNFLWFPSGNSLPVATGLPSGNYNIAVTDAHNCSTAIPVTISEPAQLLSTINSFGNVLCPNDSTGFANVIANGGSSPYSYLWSPGGENVPSVTGLAAGNYSVTVSDNNGCSTFSSITITQPSPIVISLISSADVSCFNGSDGFASVSVTGGSVPYSYLWSGGGGNSAIANNLSAGNYTVIATDANGCSDSLSVTINQPTAVSSTVTTVDAICFGFNNGSATVVSTGGVGPYVYNWNPGGAGSNTLLGLPAGNFDVTTTDSHGCTTVSNFVISEPAELNLIMSSTNATCGNANGAATVSVSGGIPSYSYFWTPVNSNAATLTNIPSGGYTVTVQDANGCTMSSMAAVSNNGAPVVNLTSVTPASCSGGNNGAATISISGGFGPFNILWQPSGGTGLTATGLTAGTYSVRVRNRHNCATVVVVTIDEPSPIQLNITTTPVSCFGGSDGQAAVLASGGTGTYSYSWNSAIGNNSSGSGLPAGNYSVTVTDQNGCTETSPAIVSQPTFLGAIINNSTPVSCYGGSDGTATVSVSGGTPPYSYVWNVAGNTSSSITGLAAGNYSVTVTDAANCSVVTAVTITQPAEMVTQATATTGTCGFSNGSATVIVSGGSAPFSYLWNQTGETSSTITGLAPGNFSVVTTDINGCIDTTDADIFNTGIINTSIVSVTNVSCFGGNDGSAQLNVIGGTAPYSFNWQPTGGSSSVANNLSAGTYSVSINDVNNCNQNINVVINEPQGLNATVIATHLLCSGDGNGTASVIASGGTGSYFYQWMPGGMNTTSIGSLNGGNYSVEVTDDNGCSTTTNVTINEPALLNLSVNTTLAGCALSNGSATATANGGTPPYNYIWSPGAIQGNIMNGIPAGSYAVIVTDSNGCTASSAASVSNTVGPTASLQSSSDVSCYSGSDGMAEISVTAGVQPLTYNWFPGGNNLPILNNLSVGTYSVTVRDSNNCVIAIPVTINQPTQINAIINPEPASCNGGSDGSAIAIVNGGTPPYSYEWSSGETTVFITGKPAGTYHLIVTDANGCTAGFNTTINEPIPISLSLHSAPVICFSRNTGFAAVSARGGTPSYTYSWSNGNVYASASNFYAGTYSVTVTDAHGCKRDTIVTISEPTIISLSEASFDVSCPGLHDGHATISASGGIPPYTYSWTSGTSTTADAYNLSPGHYGVTVTDANGCSQKIDLNIGSPNPINLSIQKTNVKCYAGNNGSARVTAIGGVPPYSYFWSNGSTIDRADDLQFGTYTVVVTDNNSCTAQASVTIDQPEQLSLDVETPLPICIGQSTVLTAVCAGGTPSFNYTWNTGSHNSTLTVSPPSTTTYTVRVSDSQGCPSHVKEVTVNVNPELLALASGTDSICAGGTAVLLAFASGGASGPYNYSWDCGGFGESITVAPTASHDYVVTVSDNCGSPPVTATVPVIVIPNPVVNFIPNPYSGCQPLLVDFNDQTNIDGHDYYWAFGDGSSDTSKNPSHIFLDAGEYTVNHIVTDMNGCIGRIVVPQAVVVYPFPVAEFTNVPEVTSIYSPNIAFFDASSNTVKWEWDFGDRTGVEFNKNPEHTYKDTGMFAVRLVTTSDKGCVDTTYGKVMIKGEFAFYIPNAFTPNGDGVNDAFMPLGIGVKEYEMIIYDRWGLRIFSSEEITKGWNGRTLDGDSFCQMDVYVYKIDIVDLQGKSHYYVGRVSLVR